MGRSPAEAGRGETGVDQLGHPPVPSAAAPAEFVERLRELRLWAGGPSLRRLRQLAGSTVDTAGVVIDALPVSTASRMLRGDRLPRMEFVRAFVIACLRARGRDRAAIAEELERWHEAWLALRREPPPPATAAAPRPAMPRQLPADAVGFTGRVDERALLTKALSEASASITAISGTGGAGKSALAIHIAHQLVDAFPDGQLYVDLHGATTGLTPLAPLEVLGRFLRALGAAGADIPDHTDEAAARFRTMVAGRRLLLVLDNAADAGQVRPLLPGAPGCRVLVTSRQPLSGLDGARHLHLDVLPEPDAVRVLARVIGAERVAAEPAAVSEVVRRCGHLPLALRIAAARLAARPAWPVAALAQRLADGGRRLDELQVTEAGVRTSLDVSYHHLRDSDDPTDQDAARAFGLLGIWDGPDLALPVAARLLDRPEAEAEPLLERLVDAQLLQTRLPGRYHLHDLIRLYARELAGQTLPDAERITSLERALRFYTATAWHTLALLRPGTWRHAEADERWAAGGGRFADQTEALAWLEAERPNLLAAADQAGEMGGGIDTAAVQLAQALFGYFSVRYYLRDWDRLNHTALRVARRTDDPIAEAHVYNALGAACYYRGRYQESIEHHQHALAIRARAGDRDGQARSLSNLGGNYTDLGQYDEALACLRQALAINRERGNRYGEASNMYNLGLVCQELGQAEAALTYYRQSLAIFEEVGDRDYQALALSGLGTVHRQQAHYREAFEYLYQGWQLYHALDNPVGEGRSLELIGTIHHAQGNYEEALDYFRQSLAIRRDLGLRQNEAEVLRDIGVTLQALGQIEQAQAHWREALAICDDLGIPIPTAELRALLAAVARG